ncbi:glycoside hydrolase family 3 N-terminal domain-containing protein [Qipengyuania sphaerica]|uniref:glycoside hydrolase family 3 N-terminal domain-containing protein n=1 Tax=Qipengyuania sphaerica TaxID=2867243 RepID=UPI001C874250|nr:glycoside hydrolase family 3 N-terminal domain-containing protein [Qipengyuania sphaerica]MBX7541246.1 glycoside hydrolase family 3 C-terminal domain-containing protein [Qipengyuania sphaerica]
MTLDEKIGQLVQRAGGRSKNLNSRLGPEELERVRRGEVGSYLHVAGAEPLRELQRVAVEESRLGIPLLFSMDVVHGYRTIFPVPLGIAASWDPMAAEEHARIAAREAAASGLHWTFAPMVDIARDARWGRIVEGSGEDAYLGSAMAAAQVHGFQGEDLSDSATIMATTKHFGAYGAAEGGRDYAGADISERTLRESYLPPFRAAADAGTASYMTAFNAVGGVPTTANKQLLNDLLRGEWGYCGVLLSDWRAIEELMAHGVAGTRSDAARLALEAGVDMDMVADVFGADLKTAIEARPSLEHQLDAAVTRILVAKEKLGLFDDPLAYHDTAREAEVILTEDHRAAARRIAERSFVLLKNDSATLPLAGQGQRVALIGALADDALSQLGSWRAQGKAEDVVTLRAALQEALPGTSYTAGADSRSDDASGIAAAVRAAHNADVVVIALGEDYDWSGEARARSELTLPGRQLELFRAVKQAGKPIVVVLMGGRPLAIPEIAEEADAVLATWLSGIEAGPAITATLLGNANPGGKLPATFPRRTGQVPFTYDHLPSGRPADPDLSKDTARYMDLPISPQYAFGHGLSYTTFDYGAAALSAASIPAQGGKITVSLRVTNTGERAGDEVVQLYMRDPVASVSRPVMQLRGFARVALTAGETKTVSFTLDSGQFALWSLDEKWLIEPGAIELMIGSASDDIRSRASFEIVGSAKGKQSPASILTQSAVVTTQQANRFLPGGAELETLAEGFQWSEGPVWITGPDGGYLLFSDVPANKAYKWSQHEGLSVWLAPSGYAGADAASFREAGSNGLIRAGRPGYILMADHGNRGLFEVDLATKEKRLLTSEYAGEPFNSPNDLALASDGTIYFTDPPYGLAGQDQSELKRQKQNGVYALAPDGKVTLLEASLSRPNGIALSPDEQTLYVANSDPERAIWVRYRREGAGWGAREVLFDATGMVGENAPGLPDGMAIAADGTLFATGPGGVHLIAPDGTHLGMIRTPRAVANVTFGGSDGKVLYLTVHDKLMRIPVTITGADFAR